MEFKNIQRNHPVYLLDKQTVEVKEGKVVANQPYINPGIATISSSGQSMRDVTIEVEGKQTIYTIPEHLGVTFAGDSPESDRNISRRSSRHRIGDKRKYGNYPADNIKQAEINIAQCTQYHSRSKKAYPHNKYHS